MSQINLPFRIGQIVEQKSFLEGFRGAWFRCKILDITTENEVLRYKLKLLDYIEEDIDNAEVFETPKGGTESQLMIRPAYPPHYHESEVLKIKQDLESPVVVHQSWKVGDLVEWLYADCYWSGKIIAIKGKKSYEIRLLPKPVGEGKIYPCHFKDLRPRLDWSPEDGWTVPRSAKGRKCARLLVKAEKNKAKEVSDVCETGKKQAKKVKLQVEGDEGLKLNIMESDSVDAAVMDIEELIVRIEWLKGKLSSDLGERPKLSWKYEDHIPSSSGNVGTNESTNER